MNQGTINFGILAGGAGGAVAIAVMEFLSSTAAFHLMLIPFATSIVLVMGMPEAGPAQPRAASVPIRSSLMLQQALNELRIEKDTRKSIGASVV